MSIDSDSTRSRRNQHQRDDNHLADLLPAFVNGSLDRASSARVRQHLAECLDCRHAFEGWIAIASATRASSTPTLLPRVSLLDRVWDDIDQLAPPAVAVGDLTEPSPAALLPHRNNARGESPLHRERIETMIQPTPAPSRRWLTRPMAGLAAAAALAAAVVLTPVGSYAQGFLTVFTPQTVAAVPISLDAMKSLPDLNNYGTFTQGARTKSSVVADAAAAGAAAKLTVLTPATLPKGVTAAPQYTVMPATSASFTFSAAKAQASAAAQGKTLPAMPKNIDGSSVQMAIGAAVVASYGQSENGPSRGELTANQAQKALEKPSSAQNLGSTLIIGQSTAPVVTSTGVSTADLEAYLLVQPGISPDLASAIRSIGDPTSTLPIPIPVSKASSHPIQVQGVQGLSIADSTSLGGGIVWVKNGIVYGVAGTFSENDLLATANSLH